jgi:hypothetical protein
MSRTNNFSAIWRLSPLTATGLQILTYACFALTTFSSDGSFTCHTLCDTGPPFVKSYSKDPWFSLLNAVLLEKEQSLPILNVLSLTRLAREGLKRRTTTRLPQSVNWLFTVLRPESCRLVNSYLSAVLISVDKYCTSACVFGSASIVLKDWQNACKKENGEFNHLFVWMLWAARIQGDSSPCNSQLYTPKDTEAWK